MQKKARREKRKGKTRRLRRRLAWHLLGGGPGAHVLTLYSGYAWLMIEAGMISNIAELFTTQQRIHVPEKRRTSSDNVLLSQQRPFFSKDLTCVFEILDQYSFLS